jgi:hypothetical protein
MKKYFRNSILGLFIVLPLSLFAQNKVLNLQVFGGYSIPTSNFALKIDRPIYITRRAGFDYGDDVGLASNGFLVGTELTIPILTDGLGWQLSAKVIVNPTDNSVIENEFNLDPKVSGNLEFETGNWINIPIFSGFSYGINIVDQMNIYLHLQAGLNVTKQPYRKATLDGTVVENTEFNWLTDFGFETGISIDYSEKYCISFRYLNLFAPRYEGQQTLNELLFTDIVQRENVIDAEEKSIALFYITFGIKI